MFSIINGIFPFITYLFLIVTFSFPLREVPLTRLVKLIWRRQWQPTPVWTEDPGRLQSMRLLRVRHDWVTSLSLFTFSIGEGNGNPLQCSCLENPRDEGAWWAAVPGVAKSRTQLSDFTFTSHLQHWRRKWQPTPVFLPGESQALGNLVDYRLWGCTELDTTEAT